MDSNDQIEADQPSTLKHLGFLKEIAVKLLLLVSNVYDLAKENSGVLKTKVISAENAVVSAVGPVYQKLKDVPEQIIVFVDDKFDKYAPALAKSLVAKVQSLVDKTIPLVQKLVATAHSIITPLITTAISLLQKVLDTTLSLLRKALSTLKSAPLVNRSLTLLQKSLGTTQSLIKSAPLVGAAQTLLQNSLNATKSMVQDLPLTDTVQSILQKGPGLALDTTKSVVGGIPFVGSMAQSLITDPTAMANQALDKTKSVVGGIPFVGNMAQSLITDPTDLANQMLDTTTSLVKENPVLETVSSVAENIAKEAQAAGTKAALQSAYLSFKLVAIPVIAQFWYKANTYPLFHALAKVMLPVVESLSEWYNKVVKYMDGKGYSLFGYLPSLPIDEMEAAYKLVKATMDGLSAVGNLVGMNNNNN